MVGYLRGQQTFTLPRFWIEKEFAVRHTNLRRRKRSHCSVRLALQPKQCKALDSLSPAASARLLEESAIFQVFFDDDVGHGIKHKLDVLRVCGAGHVGVDLLDVSAHVEVQELHLDVVTSILVSVGAFMGKWAKGKGGHVSVSLSLEKIPFRNGVCARSLSTRLPS